MHYQPVAQIVAGVLLVIYLVASVTDGFTSGSLVQLMITGAILLLFGDAIRKYRQ